MLYLGNKQDAGKPDSAGRSTKFVQVQFRSFPLICNAFLRDSVNASPDTGPWTKDRVCMQPMPKFFFSFSDSVSPLYRSFWPLFRSSVFLLLSFAKSALRSLLFLSFLLRVAENILNERPKILVKIYPAAFGNSVHIPNACHFERLNENGLFEDKPFAPTDDWQGRGQACPLIGTLPRSIPIAIP